jgi:hypothetical protein
MSLKLTAQLYQEILASLRSDSPQSRTTEKRAQGRVGLRCSVDIIPATPRAKPVTVWVRDISMKGIGIVSPVGIPEGMMFIVQLPRDREAPLTVTYKVVHCRRINSDLFSIGCMLVTVSEESAKPAVPKRAPVAAAK